MLPFSIVITITVGRKTTLDRALIVPKERALKVRTKYMNVVTVRQVRSRASVSCATCYGANAIILFSNTPPSYYYHGYSGYAGLLRS